MVGQQRSARGRHEGRPPAVTYDADVAARTNMPRAQTPTSEVHARSYDPIDKWYGRAGGLTTADVAARTTRRVVKMPWVCPTRSRMPPLSLQEDRQLSELA
jgi:hypothetical protein